MSTPAIDFDMDFQDNEQSDADKKLVAIFYSDVVKNEAKSAEAGRPIFDDVDLVKIITPGSRDTFVGDATPEYQARFPRQWARYKAGKDQNSASGTPLNQLPWLTPGQIAEFNALQVHTVEHLAGMSDALAHKFMGFHAMRDRAQAYLEAAKSAAPFQQMEKKLQDANDQLAEQKRINEAMAERLAALENASKAGKVPTSPQK